MLFFIMLSTISITVVASYMPHTIIMQQAVFHPDIFVRGTKFDFLIFAGAVEISTVTCNLRRGFWAMAHALLDF